MFCSKINFQIPLSQTIISQFRTIASRGKAYGSNVPGYLAMSARWIGTDLTIDQCSESEITKNNRQISKVGFLIASVFTVFSANGLQRRLSVFKPSEKLAG